MDIDSTVGGQNQLKQTLSAEGHIPNPTSSPVKTLISLCSEENHKTQKLMLSLLICIPVYVFSWVASNCFVILHVDCDLTFYV